jgi:fermentation-respiration switch protein FrsA (DUF1100 family)
MIIAAENDELIPFGTVKDVYERAGNPKAMHTLPVTHFEVYYDPWLSKAAGAAIDWFESYLKAQPA